MQWRPVPVERRVQSSDNVRRTGAVWKEAVVFSQEKVVL